MAPTDALRAGCTEDRRAATKHDFTSAMAECALERNRRAGRLQRHFLFVEGFAWLRASAIANGPSLADVVPGARFLGLIWGKENTCHLRSFKALKVASVATEIAPEAQAFRELMYEARLTARHENMWAAPVAVPERTCLEWAAPREERAGALPFWLGKWMSLLAGAGFEGVVGHLQGQLDSLWPNRGPKAQNEAAQLFQYAVSPERAVPDAAWRGFPAAR